MSEDSNLRYLEREWLSGQPAQRALRHVRQSSDKALSVLLRHHDETESGISDQETWIRDDLDFLLGFYSIVEIAVMIGFVRELPEAFEKRHLRVLDHPAVRQYYEWNYPLDLPRRLRERILFGIGYHVWESTALHPFFYEFLELTKAIERDRDMESFLWCLDGGHREDKDGASDLRIVTRALYKADKLANATQRPPKKRTELDRALNGFCKFIQFCDSLDGLIQRLKTEPEVAEAMWLAHAYWFRRLATDMGSDLKKAVLSLARWSVGSRDKTALRSRIAEINKIISRLSVPPTTRWKIYRGRNIVSADDPAVVFEETVEIENMKLKKLLNMSVDEIELSIRAANNLNNAGIRTIGQLVEKTERQLLEYPNFSERSIDEIKSKLQELGLGLGLNFRSQTTGSEAEQAHPEEAGA